MQQQDRRGEAHTLGELGLLYDARGRLDEAVTFHRQAAAKCVELQDMANEGAVRGNAGSTLVRLGRYDEARQELLRAIECREPYGHAAEPWKTWAILHDLEQATGHPQAAHAARQKAIQAFLAYRRAGGETRQGISPQPYQWVAQAIHQNQRALAERTLAQLAARPDLPAYRKPLLPKLQAILRGHRDPALADDPSLHYTDAAELLLLLEQL